METDNSTPNDCNYRAIILQRLNRRNNIANQFDGIFEAYNELTQCVINAAQNARFRTASVNELTLNDNSRVSELQEELSILYRKKEQNDQQLIETNNRMGTLMSELSAISILKDNCQKENVSLKKKLQEVEEESSTTKLRNQFLSDELFALQASYRSLENKYRLVDEERNSLIDRMKVLKEKEIMWINEQNEKEMELQRRRLQSEIELAADAMKPSDDKMFELVDAEGFKVTAEFIGDIIPSACRFKLDYGTEVNDIVWHPSGDLLAAGGNDQKVRLYALVDNKLEKRAILSGCNDSVLGLDFCVETNQVLGAACDCAIRIWNCSDHSIKHSLTGHGNKVSSAKFFHGGCQVVSGSHDRTFKMWDLITRKCARTYFIGSLVLDIICVDSSDLVVTGHHDTNLRFWDVRVSEPVRLISLNSKINGLARPSDMRSVLASTRNETLSLIDLRNWQTLHIYSADQYRTTSDHCRCAISPGMDYVAAGSADGLIYVWDLRSTKLEKRLQKGGHERGVTSVSWHPKGNMIISGDKLKTVCLWTV